MNLKFLVIGLFLLGGVVASLILYTLKRPNPLFENDVPKYKDLLSQEDEDADEDEIDKKSKTNKIIRMVLSGVSGVLFAVGLFLLFKSFTANKY